MTTLEYVTDEGFQRELEQRRRLLPHVIQFINEDVIRTAAHGMTELLTDMPSIGEDLLQPLFENSDFWPQQMAQDALGLSMDEEFTVEELLEKFEAFMLYALGERIPTTLGKERFRTETRKDSKK